ncbi:MAG: hypothetical protein ACRCZH_07990 [Cetobacterium sp.]|uniref:hypothetical protein n=2 Tax=Bacteria TaxID=2 RepID=UPI003F39B008
MNKNIKNKGLTFLETVVVVTIIFIVSSFLFIKIIKINEKLDLEKNRKIFQVTLSKYSIKSIYRKERYLIEFDFLEKEVRVKKNNILIETLNLSKKLNYEIPYNKIRNPKFIFETTTTGNLSKAFTLYIFGYNNQVENRLAFYTFQRERVLKINTYLNIGVKNVNYNNILEYHYSSEGEGKIGWEEEEIY